jgi:hypothetical protein
MSTSTTSHISDFQLAMAIPDLVDLTQVPNDGE